MSVCVCMQYECICVYTVYALVYITQYRSLSARNIAPLLEVNCDDCVLEVLWSLCSRGAVVIVF